MDTIKDYFNSGLNVKEKESELTKTDIKTLYKKKDFDDIVETIKEDYNNFEKEKKKSELKKENKIIEELYNEIKQYLITGYNVNLYGIGKKDIFIENFLKEYFEETIIIYINTNSSLKISNILIYIINELFKIEAFNFEEAKRNFDKLKNITIEILFIQLNKIMADLKSLNEYVVLYITDICGKNFRDSQSQTYLSEIFKIENIMGITTIENCYYPMILSREIINNFNFVYLKVNTFIPYDFENIQDRGELFVEKNKKSYDSFKMVILNLTDVQKDLLIFLLKTLIDENNFISKKKFYQYSLNGMYVSDENQLNDNLREAIDHKILLEQKNEKGSIGYKMPFDIISMKKLYDEVQDEY